MPRAALLLSLVLASPGCSSGPVPNLKSGDPYERYLGALEISDSSDPADRKTLEGLLKDSDPLTRIGAIVAISQSRTPESLKLVTAMLADPDTGVRTEAVRAVAGFQDPASVDALFSVVDNDASLEASRTAARELGRYPDSETLRRHLLDAMADPRAPVAFNAHRSLLLVTKRADLPRDRSAAEQALKRS